MPIRSATVRAADIPSSQTDFTFYVDLGRVGATALTLAEAESSRWYTDTDLVTQMAREIVSLTEGHGKYASLTSTSKIAIDYDGIRADYAVSDTFGRNAVWTGYRAVYHLDGLTDSTSGGLTLTNTASTPFGAGKMANAANFGNNASSPGYRLGVASNVGIGVDDSWTASFWWKNTQNDSGFGAMLQLYYGGSTRRHLIFSRDGANNRWIAFTQNFGLNGSKVVSVTNNEWYLIHLVQSGGTITMYANTTSRFTVGRGSTVANAADMYLGRPSDPGWWYRGDSDSLRFQSNAVSANWRTTEYNNQNAESTFWGTWTTFGGGAAAVNARRLFLMMM